MDGGGGLLARIAGEIERDCVEGGCEVEDECNNDVRLSISSSSLISSFPSLT